MTTENLDQLKRDLDHLIAQAEQNGLWLHCSYQDLWFSPAEHRKVGDGSRFDKLLETVVGRRLTYRVLCAIGDAGFMGIK